MDVIRILFARRYFIHEIYSHNLSSWCCCGRWLHAIPMPFSLGFIDSTSDAWCWFKYFTIVISEQNNKMKKWKTWNRFQRGTKFVAKSFVPFVYGPNSDVAEFCCLISHSHQLIANFIAFLHSHYYWWHSMAFESRFSLIRTNICMIENSKMNGKLEFLSGNVNFATRWACEFFSFIIRVLFRWTTWCTFDSVNAVIYESHPFLVLCCSMTIEDLPLSQIVPHELRNLPFTIKNRPLFTRYLSKGVFGPSLSWLYDVAFTLRISDCSLSNGDSFGSFLDIFIFKCDPDH